MPIAAAVVYSVVIMCQPATIDRFRADLVMIPLRSVGLNSPLAQKAHKWITSMTVSDDAEEGQAFWDWIVQHYNWNVVGAGSLLDSYFFCDVRNSSLLATISLVRDDLEVGKTYSIPGVWMGGANVRREWRNHGVMAAAFGQLDAYIKTIVDATGDELTVNMFTGTEIMAKIAVKAGFVFRKTLRVDFFGEDEHWHNKIFSAAESSNAR